MSNKFRVRFKLHWKIIIRFTYCLPKYMCDLKSSRYSRFPWQYYNPIYKNEAFVCKSRFMKYHQLWITWSNRPLGLSQRIVSIFWYISKRIFFRVSDISFSPFRLNPGIHWRRPSICSYVIHRINELKRILHSRMNVRTFVNIRKLLKVIL